MSCFARIALTRAGIDRLLVPDDPRERGARPFRCFAMRFLAQFVLDRDEPGSRWCAARRRVEARWFMVSGLIAPSGAFIAIPAEKCTMIKSRHEGAYYQNIHHPV